MITKNFKMIARLPFAVYSTSRSDIGSVKMRNGNYTYPSLSTVTGTTGNDYPLTGTTDELKRFAIVGNGTTPPSTSDYDLENTIDTLTIYLSNSFPNKSENIIENSQNTYSNIDNYGILNYAVTVTNNTDSAITISEIGFCMQGAFTTDSMLGILIDREVFEPITIEPNEAYSFYVKIG